MEKTWTFKSQNFEKKNYKANVKIWTLLHCLFEALRSIWMRHGSMLKIVRRSSCVFSPRVIPELVSNFGTIFVAKLWRIVTSRVKLKKPAWEHKYFFKALQFWAEWRKRLRKNIKRKWSEKNYEGTFLSHRQEYIPTQGLQKFQQFMVAMLQTLFFIGCKLSDIASILPIVSL